MSTLIRDLRHALRRWGRAPGFVAVALVTVAVATGGTTTMMSVTDAVLLRARPGVQDPEGLVEIRVADRARRTGRLMAYSAFEGLRDAPIGLESLAAGDQIQASVAQGPEAVPEVVAGVATTGGYFSVLGTRPALGRFFTPAEDRTSGGNPVVVLSHRFWTRSFGGDPSVLGRTVSINRVPLRVIGVAEEGFHGHLPLYDFSLFVPLTMLEPLTGRTPEESTVATVGRLEPGVSIQRVRTAADRVAGELRSVHPADWVSTVFLVEPHMSSFQEFRGPISMFLGFLLALSGCILLIAGANLAVLLLSRAMARAHELAVRRAMGAGRGRLVGELLTETLLLFLAGGAGGLALAFGATGALRRVDLPLGAPITGDFGPNLRVLCFSLAVTLAFGLVFGLAPAVGATRPDVASILRDEGGCAPGRQRLRKAFILLQVAGSVAILGGSGLLFKALTRANGMDLGFEPRNVHVATVNLGIQQYSEAEGRAFLSRLLEGGAALPGVESAALTDFVFLASPPERAGTFSNSGGEGQVMAGLFGVSPSFFTTTGTRIVEGRSFDLTDVADSEPVAIVNERVAEILWPGENPVGKAMRSGQSLLQVVGVAKDGKYISIGESPLAGVFRPQTQLYTPTTSLLLKVREGSPGTRRGVLELVRALDPGLPLTHNDSHSVLIGRQLLPRRAAALFSGILGLLGLSMAAVGLYGVLSHLVVERAREMAIRIALGAHPRSVRRSVIRSGLGLVLGGLMVGLPLAVSLSLLIRRFLYGLDPLDPGILGSVTVLFLFIGFLASWVPALQATRTHPSQILRRG